MRRRLSLVAAAALAGSLGRAPCVASAEGLFDLFFGAFQKQQQQKPPPQANFFADPFNQQPAPPPRPVVASGSGPAVCLRSFDVRYFPLTMRGGASPIQMCQAFCPASPTKVFFGSNIDGASSASGERYGDSETAFA